MFKRERNGPSNITDGRRNAIIVVPNIDNPTTMASYFHTHGDETASYETWLDRFPDDRISSCAIRGQDGIYGF